MARQSKKLKEPEALDMDAMLLEEQVDPVSGNTAPLGALPAEVRDDIEVNVSPNEFVVNAATVRYFGQEFFDNLQDTAEDGWERIASTGDLPFRDDELEFEEGDDEPRVNFNEGDIVEEGDGLTETEIASIPTPTGGGYQGSGGVGGSSMGYDFKTYSNASGNEIRVYFYNGRPLSKIPEGYEEGDSTDSADETVEEAVARVVEARDDDDKWARQAGVHSSASPEEIFNAMGITKNGVDKSQGYWNTTPETWTSSDWASYNKTVGGSFQIPGTDIKIDPAQAVMTGIVGMASAGLGLAFNYGMNVGKDKMAAKANTTALSMIKSGDFGGSDPRTVLNTAYSTGVMLGKITEATPFETWAKTTLSSSKVNFTKIPEVNQSLMNQVRPINNSIGLGWTTKVQGEQLYNSIELHKSYTRDPSKGQATTTVGGYVVGMIGSLAGGQAGMLADGNGVAVRDPITNAVVRVDDQGNPYVMTGIFGTKKIPIDRSVVFDRSVDPLPNIITPTPKDDSSPITTTPYTSNSGDIIYDPVEDVGGRPDDYTAVLGGGDPEYYGDDIVGRDIGSADSIMTGMDAVSGAGEKFSSSTDRDLGSADSIVAGMDAVSGAGEKADDPDQGDPRPRQLKNSQAASDKITKESGTIGIRQSGNTTITNPSGSQPGLFNRKVLDDKKVIESAKTNRVYGKAEGGLVSRPKKNK